MQAEAQVATDKSVAYMKQLCRHFAHKVPAEFTDERGSAQFDMGSCELLAEPGVLIIRAQAATPEDLDRVKGIVASHLERFAFREQLTVAWAATE